MLTEFYCENYSYPNPNPIVTDCHVLMMKRIQKHSKLINLRNNPPRAPVLVQQNILQEQSSSTSYDSDVHDVYSPTVKK